MSNLLNSIKRSYSDFPFNPGTFFGSALGIAWGNNMYSLCKHIWGFIPESHPYLHAGLEVTGCVMGIYYGNELYEDLIVTGQNSITEIIE